MSEANAIILVYLRRIDEKVDRLIGDVQDLKQRMTAAGKATVGLSRRVDRLDLRLDLIERRLDL